MNFNFFKKKKQTKKIINIIMDNITNFYPSLRYDVKKLEKWIKLEKENINDEQNIEKIFSHYLIGKFLMNNAYYKDSNNKFLVYCELKKNDYYISYEANQKYIGIYNKLDALFNDNKQDNIDSYYNTRKNYILSSKDIEILYNKINKDNNINITSQITNKLIKEKQFYSKIQKELKEKPSFLYLQRKISNSNEMIEYMKLFAKSFDKTAEKIDKEELNISIDDSKLIAFKIIKALFPKYYDKFSDAINKIDLKESKKGHSGSNSDQFGIIHAQYLNDMSDILVIIHEFSHSLSHNEEQIKNYDNIIETFVETPSIVSQLCIEKFINIGKKTNANYFRKCQQSSLKYIYCYNLLKYISTNNVINDQIIENYFKSFGEDSIEYKSFLEFSKECNEKLEEKNVYSVLQENADHPFGLITGLKVLKDISNSNNMSEYNEFIESLKCGKMSEKLCNIFVKNNKLNTSPEFLQELEEEIIKAKQKYDSNQKENNQTIYKDIQKEAYSKIYYDNQEQIIEERNRKR